MQPTIEIEVDLEKAQAVGLTPGSVRRAEATLLQGIQVGSVFEEQKVFDVDRAGRAGDPPQRRGHPQPAHRPPGRRYRPARPGRRRPDRRDPVGHPAGRRVAADGHRGRRRRPQRRRRRRRRRGHARRRWSSRWSTTPRCCRRAPPTRSAPDRCSAWASPPLIAAFLLFQAAVPQLAAGAGAGSSPCRCRWSAVWSIGAIIDGTGSRSAAMLGLLAAFGWPPGSPS